MEWYVTHTAIDSVLDVELIVEKESPSGLWFFNIRSGNSGSIVYRSNAEWNTPEEARQAAETWYEQSEFKIQRAIQKELMFLEYVASHAPYEMADTYISPFLPKLVQQGDVQENRHPGGSRGFEITGHGILRLGDDQCPYCHKQRYGEKEHSWCVREHQAKATQ